MRLSKEQTLRKTLSQINTLISGLEALITDYIRFQTERRLAKLTKKPRGRPSLKTASIVTRKAPIKARPQAVKSVPKTSFYEDYEWELPRPPKPKGRPRKEDRI